MTIVHGLVCMSTRVVGGGASTNDTQERRNRNRRGDQRETRERGNLFLVSAVKSDTARAVYSKGEWSTIFHVYKALTPHLFGN
jgi:hypothetical protein